MRIDLTVQMITFAILYVQIYFFCLGLAQMAYFTYDEFEGFNRVNRQSSKGLKFNRQPSKKVLFSRSGQKCKLILTVKKVQGISSLAPFF